MTVGIHVLYSSGILVKFIPAVVRKSGRQMIPSGSNVNLMMKEYGFTFMLLFVEAGKKISTLYEPWVVFKM